nr:MAG TPA: hypothetical protein [Bacteriophage sp.]
MEEIQIYHLLKLVRMTLIKKLSIRNLLRK